MRVNGDIICVRGGSREHSVVFLPGLGAPPSEMAPLAGRIGGSGAVYILDLLGLAAADGEPLTVESLARRGLCAVNEAGGADAFVGYSFGGLVALEMARLARADGESAPRPILIDAFPEQSHWPRKAWLSSLWSRTVQHTKTLGSLSAKEAVPEFRRRANGLIVRMRRRRAASIAEAVKAADLDADRILASSAGARMTGAFCLYRPAPYLGRLTLIESSDPIYATPASTIWRPLVSKLEVLRYSGGHLDAVRSEACLDLLAAQLNTCLGLTA
jgi:acetoacetyl-CoA synthetase